VDDLRAAAAKAAATGGTLVKQPCPEGDIFVATVRDPAGNFIGLWQAAH
jgi:predicted enzyme related to lactoylglutathione lyase